MKLRQLDLFAYGNFTNAKLNFERDGLHIVYGSNEAGKSTTLRALRGLLFGFPTRGFVDDYRHPVQRIKVGGTLSRGERTLEIVRRKRKEGKIETLSDPQGEAIDRDSLLAFLGSVNAETFSSLYAIDQKMLQAGGEALLQGDGDVGKSLFDAAGARGVATLLASLRAEADSIFKKNAKKPLLNQSIGEYKRAKAALKEGSTDRGAYEKQVEALETLEAELASLEAERLAVRRRRDALQLEIAVVPQLRIRAEAQKRLAALGHVPALPSDAIATREAALSERAEAERQLKRCQNELELVSGNLAELDVNDTLLELDTDTIDAFFQRLDLFRNQVAELKACNEAMAEIRVAIETQQRHLGLDPSSSDLTAELLLSAGDLALVRKTCDDLEQAQSHQNDVARRLREAKRRLAAAQTTASNVTSPQDISRLKAAVRHAQALGNIDYRERDLAHRHQVQRAAIERALAALHLTNPGELESARLPSVTALKELTKAHESNAAKSQHLEQQERECRFELKSLEAQLAALTESGTPATEKDLLIARKHRDDAIEEALAGKKSAAKTKAALQAIEAADAVADTLRRDAEKIAKYESLTAQLQTVTVTTKAIRAEHEQTKATGESFKATWLAKRSPQPPGHIDSVGEITAYYEELNALNRQREAAEELATAHEALVAERKDAIQRIQRAVPTNGASKVKATDDDSQLLDSWVAQATTMIDEQVESDRAAHAATSLLEREDELVCTLAREQSDACKAVASAAERLGEQLAGVAWGAHASASEATYVRAQLMRHEQHLALQASLIEKQREAAVLQTDIRSFSDRTRTWWAALQTDAPPEIDVAAAQLVAEHRKHTERATERQRLMRQKRQLEIEAERAKFTQEAALGVLDGLLRAAGLATVEELKGIDDAIAEHQRLSETIERVDQVIVQQTGDLALAKEGLLSHADLGKNFDLDLDLTKARLEHDDLEHQLNELTERERQVARSTASVRAGLQEAIAAKTRAAESATRMQSAAAAVRELLRRYARLKAAIRILESEIERYRRQNQDPIVALTSTYFARLTLGRYRGLTVENTSDAAQLFAHPATNDKTQVWDDGIPVQQLSDGTRDQLYLSLILATLQRRAKEGTVLPLVVDDVLVNFDDERKAACLELLHELATTSQVLLFTHSAHDLTIAQQTLPKREYTVHPLSVAASDAVN